MRRILSVLMLAAACGGTADYGQKSMDRPPRDHQPMLGPTPIIVDQAQNLTTTGYTGFTSWDVSGDSVNFRHWCRYKCIPTVTTVTFTGCGPTLSTTGVPMGGGVNRISYAGDQQICYQSASQPFDTVGCVSFATCSISGTAWASSVFRYDGYDDVSKLFTVTDFAGAQVGQLVIQ